MTLLMVTRLYQWRGLPSTSQHWLWRNIQSSEPTTICMVLSIAISSGWSIKHSDIQNAFLHGVLNEEVYMSQPHGYSHPQHPNHVCCLQKALYGLKQAPWAWFSWLTNKLLDFGFQASKFDTSLFIYKPTALTTFSLIYVDSIIITSLDSTATENLLLRMKSEFGEKTWVIEIFFLRYRDLFSSRWHFFVSKMLYAGYS